MSGVMSMSISTLVLAAMVSAARIGTDDPASGVFHFSPNVRMPTLSAIFQLKAIFRPTET
jgi:hypothetical protein